MTNQNKTRHGDEDMKRFAFTIVELLVVIVIIGILIMLFDPIGIPLLFVFGWIPGIYHLISGLKHEPVAVLIGVVSLVLLPMFVHLFLRQLPTMRFQTWRFRQSVAIVGIACAFIVATIGMIAVIHEVYWISHPAKPMSVDYRTRNITINNMKQIVIAASTFASGKVDGTFPPGGTLLKDGRAGHGWMTLLLPYLEETSLYERIDLRKPWDDPAHVAVFQTKTPNVLRTFSWNVSKDRYRNAEGYALTDIAANEHVMPFGRSLRIDDITDGTSTTLFCGEVRENFKPWGSPFNGRDPAIGLNTSPHGFGSSNGYDTVTFAWCDGSVQRISTDIDPKILRALATPNGGEKVDRGEL